MPICNVAKISEGIYEMNEFSQTPLGDGGLYLQLFMQIHYDIENLPQFRNAVVTIGTFDGVHLGHQKIIDRLKIEAAAIDGETVIITFHPHPRKIVSSTIPGIRLINTLEEKIEFKKRV